MLIINAGDKTGCGRVTGNKVLTNVGLMPPVGVAGYL